MLKKIGLIIKYVLEVCDMGVFVETVSKDSASGKWPRVIGNVSRSIMFAITKSSEHVSRKCSEYSRLWGEASHFICS